MNIIDAVKSGKRFKLPGWDEYYANDGSTPFVHNLSNFDLVRDDFEIEEEKISITRSQLEEAWDYLFRMDKVKNVNSCMYQTAFPLLAERLGFKS